MIFTPRNMIAMSAGACFASAVASNGWVAAIVFGVAGLVLLASLDS